MASGEGGDNGAHGPKSAANFRARLEEVIRQLGQDNAVQATGRSAKTLKRYVDGDTEPPFLVIAALAASAGMSITWLATGQGPRDSSTQALHVDLGTQPEHGNAGMLQIVDPKALRDGAYVILPRFEVKASAGRGSFNDGEGVEGFLAFNAAHLRADGINPAMADVIEIEGRSMMPAFVHGELVVVDRSATDIISGNIYAVVYQNTLRIKRLQKERSAVVLVSDNKTEGYIDERIEGADLADFRVVGRVRRHVRSL